MVNQGIYQLIAMDSTVAPLITDSKNNVCVYWIQIPKGGSYPNIVLSWVATSDTITVDGDAGFRNALLQIDCYASTFYQSKTIATAVRSLLKSYKGNLPDTDSTAVAGVLQTKDWDMPFEEGSTGFVYRAMQEFRIWYYDATLPITPTSSGPAVIDGGTF